MSGNSVPAVQITSRFINGFPVLYSRIFFGRKQLLSRRKKVTIKGKFGFNLSHSFPFTWCTKNTRLNEKHFILGKVIDKTVCLYKCIQFLRAKKQRSSLCDKLEKLWLYLGAFWEVFILTTFIFSS